MRKIFVSGTYDIIHAGHIQFFNDAKKLGDHLTVCFASDEVISIYKNRKSALPEDNKRVILENIKAIDRVVMSSNNEIPLDFRDHLSNDTYDILVVTEDDKNLSIKKAFCEPRGIEVIVLPKTPATQNQVSTTSIRAKLKNITEVPLRVDFAGGWLDVPKFSRPGSYIVNCTITPKVSLKDWPYHKGSGLGGSAAHAILEAKSGISAELAIGVGWQDPAIIKETGLCVWRSAQLPTLEVKYNPDWLSDLMLIVWTEKNHRANDYTDNARDFDAIQQAGYLAYQALKEKNILMLGEAITKSYSVQREEGMEILPDIEGSVGKKYLGAGHGGYVFYLFSNKAARDKAHHNNPKSKIIEPYIKQGEELLDD
jgi:cytidyltransferase-like protein